RRLGHRRNFSLNFNFSSATNNQFQNPTYDYIKGSSPVPTDQVINVHSRTNTIGTTLSYIEPLGKTTYLELSYSFSHASTINTRITDTTELNSGIPLMQSDSLSIDYNYT